MKVVMWKAKAKETEATTTRREALKKVAQPAAAAASCVFIYIYIKVSVLLVHKIVKA